MSSSAKSGSIGCIAVIGVVFVVLKLLAVPPVASWSWIWVLCPFWIGSALDVLFALLAAVIMIWMSSRGCK